MLSLDVQFYVENRLELLRVAVRENHLSVVGEAQSRVLLRSVNTVGALCWLHCFKL